MKPLDDDSSLQRHSVAWPARRSLFRARASTVGKTFWIAILLVAVGAAFVLAAWQPAA